MARSSVTNAIPASMQARTLPRRNRPPFTSMWPTFAGQAEDRPSDLGAGPSP